MKMVGARQRSIFRIRRLPKDLDLSRTGVVKLDINCKSCREKVVRLYVYFMFSSLKEFSIEALF